MVRVTFTQIQQNQNFRFSDMKVQYRSMVFPYFLHFFKYFGNKYGLRGSRFSRFVSRSKNVLKSVAIDHESLISDLGIIKTSKTLIIIFRNQATTTLFLFCHILGPIEPVVGPENTENLFNTLLIRCNLVFSAPWQPAVKNKHENKKAKLQGL